MVTIPVYRIPNRSCKAKGRSMATVVAEAIVDEQLAHLGSYFWTLHSGYACRHDHGVRIFLHHAVVGRRAGMDVSHENANKLDNRLENLRHVTRSENVLNCADALRSNRKSCQYRGVSRDRKPLQRPWRGKVTVGGKIYQTARYETPEDAHEALVKLRASIRVREFPEGLR